MDAGALNAERDSKVDTGPLRGWLPAVAALGVSIYALYLGSHLPSPPRLPSPGWPTTAQSSSRTQGKVS